MQTESDRLTAIIDTLRFRNILVDGRIAEEAPAEELVSALDEAFEEATGELATRSDINVYRAEVAAFKAEVLAAIAQSDAGNARGRLTLVIAIAALIATAVGLILGLN